MAQYMRNTKLESGHRRSPQWLCTEKSYGPFPMCISLRSLSVPRCCHDVTGVSGTRQSSAKWRFA